MLWVYSTNDCMMLEAGITSEYIHVKLHGVPDETSLEQVRPGI